MARWRHLDYWPCQLNCNIFGAVALSSKLPALPQTNMERLNQSKYAPGKKRAGLQCNPLLKGELNPLV